VKAAQEVRDKKIMAKIAFDKLFFNKFRLNFIEQKPRIKPPINDESLYLKLVFGKMKRQAVSYFNPIGGVCNSSLGGGGVAIRIIRLLDGGNMVRRRCVKTHLHKPVTIPAPPIDDETKGFTGPLINSLTSRI
jgi:hypothetical protein